MRLWVKWDNICKAAGITSQAQRNLVNGGLSFVFSFSHHCSDCDSARWLVCGSPSVQGPMWGCPPWKAPTRIVKWGACFSSSVTKAFWSLPSCPHSDCCPVCHPEQGWRGPTEHTGAVHSPLASPYQNGQDQWRGLEKSYGSDEDSREASLQGMAGERATESRSNYWCGERLAWGGCFLKHSRIKPRRDTLRRLL